MIIGKRIRLRAIEREDLPRFKSWLNDPEVRQGLSLYLPLSMSDEESWFAEMLKRPPEERSLGIEANHDGQWVFLGNVGFVHLGWRDREAEVGIFIGEKSYWNQGYGREAMRLMLRHAFNTLNLNRVSLRVFETNLRAIHSYENAGFKHEGRMRQARFQDGQYIDILLMSVLRSEWQDAEE